MLDNDRNKKFKFYLTVKIQKNYFVSFGEAPNYYWLSYKILLTNFIHCAFINGVSIQ